MSSEISPGDQLPAIAEPVADQDPHESGESLPTGKEGEEPDLEGGSELQLDHDENAEDVVEILARSLMFREFEPNVLQEILAGSERVRLKPGETLEMQDGSPLYILEHGSLQVTAGTGPSVNMSKGFIFNWVCWLGLMSEAETLLKNQGRTLVAPEENSDQVIPSYELLVDDQASGNHGAASMGSPAGDFGDKSKTQELCDSALFYNLCPHALLRESNEKRTEKRRASALLQWLPQLEVKALQRRPAKDSQALTSFDPNDGNELTDDSAFDNECGHQGEERDEDCLQAAQMVQRSEDVILVALQMETIRHVASTSAADSFQAKIEQQKNIWRTLLSMHLRELRGVPPEVMWQIAQIGEKHSFASGQKIINEADSGQESESLIILDEGTAVVEKGICANGKHGQSLIGRLGPGAVIGDVCLFGANVPRAASVKAVASCKVVVIPAYGHGFLYVMHQFPGMVVGMEPRLKEISGMAQMRLPSTNNGVSSLKLFAQCDQAFISEISSAGERQFCLAGKAIKERGKDDGLLYILEYGTCCIEGNGESLVECHVGTCFGDKALLGFPPKPKETVCVLSPMALFTVIPHVVIHKALNRFPAEQRRFESLKSVAAGQSLGETFLRTEVFHQSSSEFVDNICRSIEHKCYMPWQTIVVEDMPDAAQMFVLKGGQVCAERDGQRLAEMCAGATFGELLMLGAVRSRTCTIRALTFCFTVEIPRAAMLASLDKYPEERQHFEQVAMHNIDVNKSIQWPMLKSAPPRLIYLLNLYAERRMLPAGDTSLSGEVAQNHAWLVLVGETVLVDEQGEKVETLRAGDCHNEQALLGVTNPTSYKVVCNVPSEVQLCSKDTWQKVLAEFPEEQERMRRTIMKCVANKVEQKLHNKGSDYSGILFQSALFRSVSKTFCQQIKGKLEAMIFEPGDTIIAEGAEGECMYFLLHGQAISQEESQNKAHPIVYDAGSVLGEAVLVSLARTYSFTVKAATLCVVQMLRRKEFVEEIKKYPQDKTRFDQLLKEARKNTGDRLKKRLARHKLFAHSTPEYMKLVTQSADDAFFAPGEVIIKQGDPCVLGEAHMYLVLAGQAIIEGSLGVVLGSVGPGDMIGEAGALGEVRERTATVHASSNEMVHCAKFSGHAIQHAMLTFPQERETLVRLFQQRQAQNEDLQQRRDVWLRETVVPALSGSPLLAGCPHEFLQTVARPLTETTYNSGQAITVAGDPTESMFVLLEGAADVEAKTGVAIGRLSDGAAWGEVACLGLFKMHPATIRAVKKCRVLELPQAALERALKIPGFEYARDAFTTLLHNRVDQVTRGVPMTALPIGISSTDVCARAVALQAERIDLAPGDIWQPLPDSDPCGAYFGVVVNGRAKVETMDGRLVVMLDAGSLVLEGLCAEYGTRIRAVSLFEGYRVRQFDFLMSIAAVPSSSEWFYRFRLIEKETKRRTQLRLDASRGVVEGLGPHPVSDHISEWNMRRVKAIDKAIKMRADKQDCIGSKLPLVPPGPLEERRLRKLQKRQASAPELLSHRESGRGLAAYPAVKLPSLKAASQLSL